jgi:carboxymethylenebutenolidase
MTELDLSTLSTALGGSPGLLGYLARPSGPAPWPGVVLVHEAFGLDDVMRRQADRLAVAGYLTLAPDLFTGGSTRRCLVSTLRALRAGTGRAFQDITAARSWLLESPDCTGKLGVIGFCMGGAFALATADTGWNVAAPNYGLLPKPAVLEQACPMVASYGGRDFSLRGAAAELERALTVAGIEHDVKEYPGAGHCFMNDAPVGPWSLRPLLRIAGIKPQPESAADAWRRIESFFDQHLR